MDAIPGLARPICPSICLVHRGQRQEAPGPEGSEERYRRLIEAALKAEAHLDSVAAIQKAIIAGLKQGGRYSTSHKEGGTNIVWRNGRYVRSDYGEDPAHRSFTDEAEFLTMLGHFCRMDVTRSSGREPLSDLDTWRLILRRLDPAI